MQQAWCVNQACLLSDAYYYQLFLNVCLVYHGLSSFLSSHLPAFFCGAMPALEDILAKHGFKQDPTANDDSNSVSLSFMTQLDPKPRPLILRGPGLHAG